MLPPCRATAAPHRDAGAGRLCEAAIQAAEQRTRIPDRLLAAIGRVESGRPDPASGAWLPWPWTIDVGGQGYFFDTEQAAIAAVRDWQAQGVHSIDVGCMQVNLAQHPNAFADLPEAFEPTRNAAYAARFLTTLHARTNDWKKAAALYHSATPALAAEYERKILAAWPGSKADGKRSAQTELASAWAATLGPSEAGIGAAPILTPARRPRSRLLTEALRLTESPRRNRMEAALDGSNEPTQD